MAGAGIGAVLGGVGGYISAYDARKQQTRMRRRQRRAIQESREFADKRVEAITGSKLYQGALSFLEGTYDDAIGTPLAQDFAKGVRQAQAARGLLFGGAAVAQEASGLAAFSQQLQGNLLPQALQFAQAPETLRQSVLGFEAPLRIAAKTGAALPGMAPAPISESPLSAAFKQAAAGGAGGYQAVASYQGLQDTPPPAAIGDAYDTTELAREGSAMDLIRGLNNQYAFGGDPNSVALEAMRMFQGDSFSAVQRMGGLK
jgi:hypothetical protein